MILYRLAKWMEARTALKEQIAETTGPQVAQYIAQKQQVEWELMQAVRRWMLPLAAPQRTTRYVEMPLPQAAMQTADVPLVPVSVLARQTTPAAKPEVPAPVLASRLPLVRTWEPETRLEAIVAEQLWAMDAAEEEWMQP